MWCLSFSQSLAFLLPSNVIGTFSGHWAGTRGGETNPKHGSLCVCNSVLWVHGLLGHFEDEMSMRADIWICLQYPLQWAALQGKMSIRVQFTLKRCKSDQTCSTVQETSHYIHLPGGPCLFLGLCHSSRFATTHIFLCALPGTKVLCQPQHICFSFFFVRT